MESDLCRQHAEDIRALCVKMEEREKLAIERFKNLDTALELARGELNRRLEGMNEFREQLNRQVAPFITAKEVMLLFDKVALRIEGLAAGIKDLESCSNVESGSKKWSNLIISGILAVILSAIISFILAHK